MKRPGAHRGHVETPDCRKVRKQVFHLLDGRLTPERRKEIRQHLEKCPACFSRLEFTRIMRQAVRAQVLAEQCPASLVHRVRALISRDCACGCACANRGRRRR